jgi:hypothetical protein
MHLKTRLDAAAAGTLLVTAACSGPQPQRRPSPAAGPAAMDRTEDLHQPDGPRHGGPSAAVTRTRAISADSRPRSDAVIVSITESDHAALDRALRTGKVPAVFEEDR